MTFFKGKKSAQQFIQDTERRELLCKKFISSTAFSLFLVIVSMIL